MNLTEKPSLNQSLVCQGKCVCESQIGVLGATRRSARSRGGGRCLLAWKAWSGFFIHRKSSSGIEKNSFWSVTAEKSLLVSKRADKATTKNKWHPGSLEVEEKLSEMCKENSTRSSDVEKKMESSKKQSMKFQQPKKKATLEKKAERFRKYQRWPNNLQRNPLLYGSLRGGAIPTLGSR